MHVCDVLGCMGDTQFHFRLRCTGSGTGGSDLSHAHYHHGAPLVLMVSTLYTCLLCMQIKTSCLLCGMIDTKSRLIYSTLYLLLYNVIKSGLCVYVHVLVQYNCISGVFYSSFF